MAKTVWIIGAGFSRGLGAPLLSDLLGPAGRDRLRATYPTNSALVDGDEAVAVYALFEDGKGKHWQHAEEFLVELDRAAHGERSVIGPVLRQRLSSDLLRNAARRIVAAECCAFLNGTTTDDVSVREVWRPYLNWASQLDKDDVIISFNYDRVIESMLGGPIIDNGGTGLHVITDERKLGLAFHAKTARLLKLHGSVSWRTSDGVPGWGFTETNDSEFALSCPAEQLAIGTPGRAKQSTTQQFRGLWSLASRELADASLVYVVGYSFQDSDSNPAMEFLSALRQTPMDRELRVVVGHDEATQRRIAYHFQSIAKVQVEQATAERFFQSWRR
jgi:hypothetical protein